MKAVFYFALILLAFTYPDKYQALWWCILVGVIIGLLKYNLKHIKQ